MGYLPKPVRHDQLRECLRKVLGIARGAWVDQHQTAQDTSPSQTLSSQTGSLSKPRILIVEDNIINPKLAVRMAEKLGYASAVVENAQEAIDILQKEHFVLVLMDCQLPVMDGFEATRLIRERERSQVKRHHVTSPKSEDMTTLGLPDVSHIPIIAVTANAMEGDRAHCLAMGMDDYLAKPIQINALRDILQRWITPASGPPDVSAPSPICIATNAGALTQTKCFGISAKTITCSDNLSRYSSRGITTCWLRSNEDWTTRMH